MPRQCLGLSRFSQNCPFALQCAPFPIRQPTFACHVHYYFFKYVCKFSGGTLHPSLFSTVAWSHGASTQQVATVVAVIMAFTFQQKLHNMEEEPEEGEQEQEEQEEQEGAAAADAESERIRVQHVN